jgi:hypothetical protein
MPSDAPAGSGSLGLSQRHKLITESNIYSYRYYHARTSTVPLRRLSAPDFLF